MGLLDYIVTHYRCGLGPSLPNVQSSSMFSTPEKVCPKNWAPKSGLMVFTHCVGVCLISHGVLSAFHPLTRVAKQVKQKPRYPRCMVWFGHFAHWVQTCVSDVINVRPYTYDFPIYSVLGLVVSPFTVNRCGNKEAKIEMGRRDALAIVTFERM